MQNKFILDSEKWLSKPRILCGLMTGTSLDGIDVAICSFSNSERKHSFKLIAFQTYPFSNEIRTILKEIISKKRFVDDVSFIHFALSKIYADAITDLCEKSLVELKDIDAIGMHGQTVWHQPKQKEIDRLRISSTFQLGSGSYLAKLLDIPVVYDFRSADIALGGQGAPLVPIFDYNFLRSENENVACLNIGGISNITYLPKNCSTSDVIAFDTGPGNVWIDLIANEFFNLNFDENGKYARLGKINIPLLNKLKNIDFINLKPPKSTGRELFNRETLYNLISNEQKNDILATLTYFTAWSIAENIKIFLKQVDGVILSGGGANNLYLIELLKKELPKVAFKISDEFGINSDAKEAICFAYLAYRTLAGLPGNICSVTGASKETILGAIAI
ncbi:MAG TPA: anhydro-N-acetylmuramic acid kinase [Candidatus Kapabacteria bacterium]|nr:anhydro-N-acetylmuramic acid kinase [Candidatus Kapabacteria bacterium]HPO62560.1 anhydro-N-acetylmuramic acid kinase [Candidatus Kapabacteria bacterium]